MKKGLVYYTDNHCDEKILSNVRDNLSKMGYPIVSVSHKPLPDFGKNIVVNMKRGFDTLFKQILIGLEASKAKVIFFVEHDVLYDPSHFEFTPPKKDVFYYNINTWLVNAKTKKAMFDNQKKLSGLCAYRKLLVKHFRNRVAMLEKNGRMYMAFEPGVSGNIDKAETWMSKNPNIDIRHDNNLISGRFDALLRGTGATPKKTNLKRG